MKVSFESLDKDVHPGVALLSFSSKTILFSYAGQFFYRMAGAVRVPDDEAVVYGVSVGDEWALSRDMRKLLDWADRLQSETKG